MATPLKHQISPAAVSRLAAQLHAASPGFPRQGFTSAATDGLPALELKARVRHVAAALRAHLPASWPDALAALCAGSGPPLVGTDAVNANVHLWPVLQVVEDHGLSHPALSLGALAELTRRFTAEFAVRPYIAAHPDTAWPIVLSWAAHEDVHVRRLASEGSRPTLPWGTHLRGTTEQGLAVIERLKDDPERYVQKSVANHLNDVSRADPARALAVARRWAAGAPPGRQWVIRHGLRTLLKAGDAEALSLVGYDAPDVVVSALSVSPKRIRVGQAVTVRATIRARAAQALMVDVAVGFQRKNGVSRKVFKAGRRDLRASEEWAWSHTLSMRPISTRQYYPGRHSVTLQINGVASGTVHFTLTETGGER